MWFMISDIYDFFHINYISLQLDLTLLPLSLHSFVSVIKNPSCPWTLHCHITELVRAVLTFSQSDQGRRNRYFSQEEICHFSVVRWLVGQLVGICSSLLTS